MFLRLRVTLKGDEKDAARKKALDLSLRYEFVTSLTSMVVTKPQEQETQVAHKPKEGAERPTDQHHLHSLLPPWGKWRGNGRQGNFSDILARASGEN